MNTLQAAFAAFATANAGNWPGLPAGVRLDDLDGMAGFEPSDRQRGQAGDPPRPRAWVAADTQTYAGGLRLWLDGDVVTALEGIHPLDADGEFAPAPDLGPPDVVLDTMLGPLRLAGGELVYAGLGLALRINPDNGLLLGLVGFTPTTAADYRDRLRPVQEAARPLGVAQ